MAPSTAEAARSASIRPLVPRWSEPLLVLEVGTSYAVGMVILCALWNPSQMTSFLGVQDENQILRIMEEPSSSLSVGSQPLVPGLPGPLPMETLRQLPGVEAVSWMSPPPYQHTPFPLLVSLSSVGNQPQPCWMVATTPSILEVLGVPLLEGRGFTATDLSDRAPARALVSMDLARALSPERSLLNQRLYSSQAPAGIEVVGVLQSFSIQGMAPNRRHTLLLLHRTELTWEGSTLARLRQGQESLFFAAFDQLRRQEAPFRQLRAATFQTLRREEVLYAKSLVVVSVVLLAGLCLPGLLGTYTCFSLRVDRRRRHLALERALGARRTDILRTLLERSLILQGVGQLLGGALGLLGLPLFLSPMPTFFEIGSVMILLSLVFAFIGLIATLGPALRASRIPPRLATSCE